MLRSKKLMHKSNRRAVASHSARVTSQQHITQRNTLRAENALVPNAVSGYICTSTLSIRVFVLGASLITKCAIRSRDKSKP
eukprot:1307858-Rhodomonas_salina.1